MTIEAAIQDLQDKLLSLSGMKSAPDSPPEGAGAFPFAVTYERTGTLTLNSYGWSTDIVTLWCEIHVSRAILPRAVEQAMSFRDPLLKLIIADPTLGDTVSTVLELRRVFGRLEWGGIETVGYRFEIDIKVHVIA
jgi:hypothetical protein